MPKKVLSLFLLLLAAFTVAACQPKTFTVTFDSQGGTAVPAVTVEKGKVVVEPETDPTRAAASAEEAWSFVGWFTDAAATQEYDFSTPIEADLTLYAGWTKNIVLRFNTKTSQTLAPVLLPESGGTVQAPPAAPTRAGYRFAGWFVGKAGLTWLEPTPVSFPLSVTKSTQLYAYWEPIDSRAVNYTDGETYTWSLTSDSSLNLNPLIYEWSHETQMIDMMVTPLYTTEVDWDKAIKDGVASAPADFSKIIAKQFSIEALDYHYILVGATKYPMDSFGDEHLNEDGKYDRQAATTYKDTEWTFNIRQDLKFEDGTPITAATYEYTLKQFLDPLQNNYRATIFYKTDANKNGHPIINSYEYYLGQKSWDEVGFEIIDDYTFKVKFSEAVSQSQAVGFGNDVRLVHPARYETSLTTDRTKSTYGTPANPFISYGAYILKTWDENQKLVFNKNYEYVLRGTISYKSQVVQIVDNVDQRMQLFADGKLSVAGLTQDYYAQYAEDPNVYKSWDGYPQYLTLNLAASKYGVDGYQQPSIMFNNKFRQALLFGFDRKYYANNVYAPNTASLLPVPLDTKSYIQDPLYYSESPAHLGILEEFGIDPSTEGYIPDRAKALFNEAYAEWIAEGNTGPVTLKLISDNSEFATKLVTYVKNHYETLFGSDKLIINLAFSAPDANRLEIRNWNFDLSLNSVGFGSSVGVWWQYQAIAFMGNLIGGGNLGLSHPNDKSQPDGYGAYYSEMLEIDLTMTYEYLLELGEDYMVESGLDGHLQLLALLEAETDEVTGAVTKPAGIYRAPLSEIASLLIYYDTPYDGSASEPFPGATNDTYAIVAAFERVFLEYATLIPTVTRSSATVYAPNVVITWPAYSTAFGWGAQRYRYLNTDPDFQQGLVD